jgi:putative endopeptidase
MNKVLLILVTVLIFSCEKRSDMKSGIYLENFDKTVRAQDDFYRYVNGTWLKNFEIPADRSNYGTFTKLYEEAQENVKTIIEESSQKTDNSKGSEEQKIGDFYNSYMDTMALEEKGADPLKDGLSKIEKTKNKKDLVLLMASLQKVGVQLPFSMWVSQDSKKATEYITYMSQSGLSLPDKKYYDDSKFSELRDKFVSHVDRMFELAGINSKNVGKKILTLETTISTSHWDRAKNRNKDLTYNKMTIAEIEKKYSAFAWKAFLSGVGLEQAENIIVRQPDYFESFSKNFKQTDLNTWKLYLKWKYINNFAPILSSDFVSENFNFFSKELNGVEKNSDRWKRGVNAINNFMGEVVGKVYVKKHFKPEAKERMNGLIDNLVKAFEKRINGLDWMGEETKVAAKEKLAKFSRKIGYPDKWKDYSKLEIGTDLFENYVTSNLFQYEDNITKLGKPIDRNEWFMNPQTVNAYYSSTMNEIVFPAAILQPPFFDLEADDAVNYGGIGAVIGHELSHGFDDQGSKSDGDGNLREWWTSDDLEKFKERSTNLVDQYSAYSPLDSFNVNGKLTLGENIGDLGGLTVAFHAYKNSLNGKESSTLDGFTGEQRVFIGWAQVWARKYRDAALQNRLLTDSHSPSEYRCNGVIINMPEFHEVFNTKETDKHYKAPEDRIIIW